MRILIAEDEVGIAKALKLVLEKNRFAVDMVHNGLDALEYMLSVSYDAVVLDIMMPGLDGLEVLKRAREKGVGTPVLFLTAKAEVEDRIRCGVGNLPKGAPKLACHFAPLNVPWVDRTFRDNGVNLSLGRVFPLASWMEEAIKHDDDPYIAAARMCLMWPDAVNMKNEAEIVIRLFEHYSFDGALFGFYDFDRWIGALQKTMIPN